MPRFCYFVDNFSSFVICRHEQKHERIPLHIGSNQSDVLHDFGNYAENTKGISFGLSIQINQKRIHGVRN